MKTTIRLTQQKDFSQIQEILWESNITGNYFTKQRFVKMLRRNHGSFFVAERDNQVIGTIFGCHDGGYFGYIYKVGVRTTHRRQGVAEALVQKVLVSFRQADIYRCIVWIKESNTASRALFAKFGIAPSYEGVCTTTLC